MPITYTPLRFPGGKSKLYPFVDSLMQANGLGGGTYAEAFCGGAGLAVKLLLKGRVSKIVLNDLDIAVYSAWDAIVNHPDSLCHFIEDVPLTVEEWERQRAAYRRARKPSLRLGKAAFYLNRTNRSGILKGGLIGGLDQTGNYKMDARFNREGLVAKVRAIAKRKADITLCNLDALDFMAQIAPELGDCSLLYLDPPYVKRGPELYKRSFGEEGHGELAKAIRAYEGKWMVTYDMDDLVDRLYQRTDEWPIVVSAIPVAYSAANHEVATERLVLGPGLVMPKGFWR